MLQIKTASVVSIICTILYSFGFWEKDGANVFCKIAIKIIYFIHYATFILTLATGAMLSENLNEQLFLITMVLICIECMVRLNYILWKKKEVCEFLNEIGAYSLNDREEYNKVNEKLKPFLTFLHGFLGVIVVGSSVACIAPALSSGHNLPLNIRFPYNWQNSDRIYWLAYIYGIIATVLSMVTTLYTTLIWYIMLNYSIKYQLFGKKLRDMGSSGESKITKIEKQNLFLRDLLEAIQIHENIHR